MCKSGCHNEDCWGDCTVSYNYCEVQKLNELKETEKRLYIIGLYDECYIDYKEVNKLLKKRDKLKYTTNNKINTKDKIKEIEKKLYIIGLYDECDIDYKEVDNLLKELKKIKH